MNDALGTVIPLQPAMRAAIAADLDPVIAQHRREILAHVHHEIRTPLTALLAHIELLEDEPDLELPLLVDISVSAIKRSGQRLRALMAELDDAVGSSVPGLTAGQRL